MREKTPVTLPPAFTSAHYAKLCENEYFRYLPNSDVIGHVLVGSDGRALQFNLPDHAPGMQAPLVASLSQLTQFDLPDNKKTVLGYVDQTPMISRRAYSISVSQNQEDPISYTFYPLSPKKNPITQQDRPIIYDTACVRRFQNTEAVRREVDTIPRYHKTGKDLLIKNEDLPERMLQKRSPDQNTVMGRHHLAQAVVQARRAFRRQRHEEIDIPLSRTASRSAVVEMSEFLDHYRDMLSNDMIRILERSVKAPFNSSEAGQARGEWLHRESHNLHPLTIDPQRADNLGAAEKRYNTEMMIAERTVQFFALNVSESRSKIQCHFDMLLDSEVVNYIDFFVWIQIAGFTFNITQHIDCFQNEPQCVKASDLASLVGILFCMMHKQAPRSVQGVAIGRTDAPIILFSGNFFRAERESSQVDENAEERLLLQ